MMQDTQTCQPNRLRSFLDGELSGREEQQLTDHLENCAQCRQTLDQFAATPATWASATTFLKDDPLDRVSLSAVSDEPLANQPQIQQVLEVLSPTDDPNMLGRLGSYEVSGVIGAGGMGVVLKALDRPLDRTVAIKVMAPHLATSAAARHRFSREARAAAAVIHPNVIAIHGVSTDTALPYLVMPYVGGASLQRRLDTESALPVDDILRIGIQIASGLAAAHNQGLVHRDIKPANILLDQGVDRLVITDFGLARAVDDASVTRTGVIAGTPQYMSPEQARGEPVDARSDLFSLGSVLYATCTGRLPFRADSPYGILRRITDTNPRPIREINPAIPDWLCHIVDRLHAKSADERFQSAHEVAHLLTQCLAHTTQPTVHPLPQELRIRPTRFRLSIPQVTRHKIAFAAIALLILTAVGLWQTRSPRVPKAISSPQTTTSPQDSQATGNPESPSRSDIPADVQPAPFPWEYPDSVTDWNDNLTPVLQQVEQRLQPSADNSRLEQLDVP